MQTLVPATILQEKENATEVGTHWLEDLVWNHSRLDRASASGFLSRYPAVERFVACAEARDASQEMALGDSHMLNTFSLVDFALLGNGMIGLTYHRAQEDMDEELPRDAWALKGSTKLSVLSCHG